MSLSFDYYKTYHQSVFTQLSSGTNLKSQQDRAVLFIKLKLCVKFCINLHKFTFKSISTYAGFFQKPMSVN